MKVYKAAASWDAGYTQRGFALVFAQAGICGGLLAINGTQPTL